MSQGSLSGAERGHDSSFDTTPSRCFCFVATRQHLEPVTHRGSGCGVACTCTRGFASTCTRSVRRLTCKWKRPRYVNKRRANVARKERRSVRFGSDAQWGSGKKATREHAATPRRERGAHQRRLPVRREVEVREQRLDRRLRSARGVAGRRRDVSEGAARFVRGGRTRTHVLREGAARFVRRRSNPNERSVLLPWRRPSLPIRGGRRGSRADRTRRS